MALKIQYNKTFLQQLNKALKIRVNALPTLQAKEAALRLEVKKAKQEVAEAERQLKEKLASLTHTHRLWCEFPQSVLGISDVAIRIRNIAGVKMPVLESVIFAVEDYSVFNAPSWIPSGIEILKELIELNIKKEVCIKKAEMLEYARKKTTQKVNLYEKVQIPEYGNAILKIKRFLEDEETLAKASQKILKQRMAAAEVAA